MATFPYSGFLDGQAYPQIGAGGATVNVANSAALTTALTNAAPGQRIVLANGTYSGAFTLSSKVGTATSPISVEAANTGGAIFASGSTFTISGSSAYVTLKGLSFPYELSSGNLVQFRGTANRCRITRCLFGPSSIGTPGANKSPFIYMGDDTNFIRIDHNEIRNKANPGNAILGDGNFTTFQAVRHIRIDHNLIRSIKPEVNNEKEPIRLGVSTMSKTHSYSVIERNVFVDCICEPEVISVKACSVRVTGNTIMNSIGGLVYRHGTNGVVTDNYIIDSQPSGGSPPPPEPDARYLLGLPTETLLARSNLVLLNTLRTTAYNDASPTANRTYDARLGTFEGYFDVDAIYPTGRTNGTNTTALTGYYRDARNSQQWKGRFCNQAYLDAGGAQGSMINVDSNAHYINQRPLRIGYTTPATFPAIIGGKVIGKQSATLSWNGMKHGSYIQDLLNAGWTGNDAWAEIIDNANQDGDPRFHIAPGSTGVVDGLRSFNGHDGFGIYGDGSRTSTGQVYMRNCWFSDVHDDGIENDEQRALHVFDCLIENCYTFLSTRADDTSGSPQFGKDQVIENCIVTFKAWPGPYQQPQSNTGHDLLYKMQTNSPYLRMKNVILAPVKFRDPSGSGPQLPTRSGDSYEGVTICWLGAGAYPGNVPSGVTVQTGATAQATVNNAVATWKSRHGVTNFDTVDMVKMLSPDPL